MVVIQAYSRRINQMMIKGAHEATPSKIKLKIIYIDDLINIYIAYNGNHEHFGSTGTVFGNR